jgi:YVTN family beta-propeller protein
MPKGVSVSRDGARVFVTNFGRRRGANLDVYDAKTLEHQKSVDYEGNSIESLSSPDGKTLYVTNLYGFLVQALDTSTWALRWSVRVGRFPKMLAISPDGRDLYVSSWESGTVSRLRAATGKIEVQSPKVGPHPRGLALHPKGNLLYVALTGGKEVLALRSDTLAEDHRIRTCGLPRHLAISGDGSRLYVSCIGGSMLQVVDTASRKVTRAVHIGAGPRTLALSRDERFVYVAAYAGHGLTVVDTSTWKKKTLDLDLVKSSGVAVSPDDRFIYVTGWCTKDLWAVERLPPGTSPGPLGRAVLGRHRLPRDPKTAWRLDCPRPAPRPRAP